MAAMVSPLESQCFGLRQEYQQECKMAARASQLESQLYGLQQQNQQECKMCEASMQQTAELETEVNELQKTLALEQERLFEVLLTGLSHNDYNIENPDSCVVEKAMGDFQNTVALLEAALYETQRERDMAR